MGIREWFQYASDDEVFGTVLTVLAALAFVAYSVWQSNDCAETTCPVGLYPMLVVTASSEYMDVKECVCVTHGR